MKQQNVESAPDLGEVLNALDNLPMWPINPSNEMQQSGGDQGKLRPDGATQPDNSSRELCVVKSGGLAQTALDTLLKNLELFSESLKTKGSPKTMTLTEIHQEYVEKQRLADKQAETNEHGAPLPALWQPEDTPDEEAEPQESPADDDKETEVKVRYKLGPTAKIISAVLFYGLLIFLIGGAFLFSRGTKKPIFSYSFMNVLTWSMQSEIPQGSMVIIKQVDPGDIQIGDDITYMRDAETSVTHRVIGIAENYENSGARGFETQGVDNEIPDFEIVPAANVVGVVKFHIPRIGSWLEWLHGHLIMVAAFATGVILLVILIKGAFKKESKDSEAAVKPARRLRTTH